MGPVLLRLRLRLRSRRNNTVSFLCLRLLLLLLVISNDWLDLPLSVSSASSTSNDGASDAAAAAAADAAPTPSTTGTSSTTSTTTTTTPMIVTTAAFGSFLHRHIYSRLLNLVVYQPPVGIVSVLLAVRLWHTTWKAIAAGLLQLQMPSSIEEEEDESVSRRRRRRRRQRRKSPSALPPPNTARNSSSTTPTTRRTAMNHRESKSHKRSLQWWSARAWNLDRGDEQYPTCGGVQSTRQRLCVAALWQLQSDASDDDPFSNERQQQQWRIEALSVTAQPSSLIPLLEFAQELIVPVSKLSTNSSTKASSESSVSIIIMHVAYWTAYMRLHDALLRIVRNRLLQSVVRLSRTERHWQRRVASLERRERWWRKSSYMRSFCFCFRFRRFRRLLFPFSWKRREFLHSSSSGFPLPVQTTQLQRDQMQWATARATYQAEAIKLGRVMAILMNQPEDLDATHLIPAAVQVVSNHHHHHHRHDHPSSSPSSSSPSSSSSGGNRLPSRYSLRWIADGRGHFSIRKLDASPEQLLLLTAPSSASVVKQEEENEEGEKSSRIVLDTLQEDAEATMFIQRAQTWVQEARRVICDVLKETMEMSIHDDHTHHHTSSVQNDTRWIESWSDAPVMDATSIISIHHDIDPKEKTNLDHRHRHRLHKSSDQIAVDWNRMLSFCDNLHSWRRVGEGQTIRIWDSALVEWTRRLDFGGIPSSFLYFKLAQVIHFQIQPSLPSLRKDIIEIGGKVLEIAEQRVWIPIQQIILDIINQNTGMMSAFSLHDEQLSLDRMLHDLHLADGSPEQRKVGLQHATEQYEQIFQSGGLLPSLIRGKLVRLLLIQVQQLKVGLLSALDTIDVLMQGNRIHFYLLATAPALALAYYSTRLLVRFLYSVRSKDPRPVTFAHADMTMYMESIEALLLQGSDCITMKKGSFSSSSSLPMMMTMTIRLSSLQLGELLLNMHRYLLLLDFGSPHPFSMVECDQIHGRLRDLWSHPGLRYHHHHDAEPSSQPQDDSHVVATHLLQDQHVRAWVQTIMRKHQGLLPS